MSLGIVGESGSGKSTLARIIVGLEEPTSGGIDYHGRDLKNFSKSEFHNFRRNVQMVFQDPYSCLNPRMRIDQIVSEGLMAHIDRFPVRNHPQLVLDAIKSVGLGEMHLDKYPRQLSGGQRQRVGIARAIVLEPEVLICDEPTSGLDVSIQAQVLNLLKDIQNDRSLSMIFISHDLGVIRHICNRVAVMYQGDIVEYGAVDQVFGNPLHPYTQALIDAIPSIQKVQNVNYRHARIESHEPVSSPGCLYASLCVMKQSKCEVTRPKLSMSGERKVACFFPLNGFNQ
jgi:oligopeptide/dipeptide ABC transporter ATP-binding protein